MITVALTTFNRSDIVGRAVRSALNFAATVGGKVVLVDDGSTDGTASMIAREFHDVLKDGTLTYVENKTNLGVTAAKNMAFAQAAPGWILFLDSDDELIPQAASAVQKVLREHDKNALIFFRCIDETGTFVGTRFDAPQQLSLRRYCAYSSYGEALIAVNKAVAPGDPFDADLRGYEGVGCARLIKNHGPALLATVIARCYNRSRSDRLSNARNMLKRADYLARGHLRYLSLCGDEIDWGMRLVLRIKALLYFSAGMLARVVWSRNA